MIKARASFGGDPVLIIGLSRLNVERLLDGMPIRFNASELGLPPLTVLILGGETEDSITEEFRSHPLVDMHPDAVRDLRREAGA